MLIIARMYSVVMESTIKHGKYKLELESDGSVAIYLNDRYVGLFGDAVVIIHKKDGEFITNVKELGL